MQRFTVLVAAVGLGMAGMAGPQAAYAQDEDEGPGTRIVSVTSFDVPFGERGTVFPWMVEYFLPNFQLNPKVLNFRVLFHNWGSNAAAVALVAEYAEFADIAAECGEPCEEYREAHPVPEEGTPEREEYDEGQAAFNKRYAYHRDEIYVAPMITAKVESEIVGRVGPPEEEEEEGGD
ncbi:MAG: hypothetical protein ACE5JR_10940 [Gemmatimonadota bacterium]